MLKVKNKSEKQQYRHRQVTLLSQEEFNGAFNIKRILIIKLPLKSVTI